MEMECKIDTGHAMTLWSLSPAYNDIIAFITFYNKNLRGVKISHIPFPQNKVILSVLDLLALLKELAENIPLDPPSSTRFGNSAFRAFILAAGEKISTHSSFFFSKNKIFLEEYKEISIYLLESLGNSIRIDYGTGHELMFLCALTILWQYLVRENAEKRDVDSIPILLSKYLDLVRGIQIRYRLEPAGSHGVWGLDDFQFIPFLWGSSQLFAESSAFNQESKNVESIPTEYIYPKNQLALAMIEDLSTEYLFFDAIRFICKVKGSTSFSRHSQLLYNISALDSWDKINKGLFRMYLKEVLGKLPVVRMIKFGKFLRWNINPSESRSALSDTQSASEPK